MMEGAYEASVDRRYLFSDRKHLDIGGHSESGKPCRIQLAFLFGAVFTALEEMDMVLMFLFSDLLLILGLVILVIEYFKKGA